MVIVDPLMKTLVKKSFGRKFVHILSLQSANFPLLPPIPLDAIFKMISQKMALYADSNETKNNSVNIVLLVLIALQN